MVKVDQGFLEHLGMLPFETRFPWINGDLQTLRDTFARDNLSKEAGHFIQIPVPSLPSGLAGAGHLLAFLDLPKDLLNIRALVLILHGLGGSSSRHGLRRMSCSLVDAGFAVLRLNLRGADPGRHLAGGTYAAECNSDLLPVLRIARHLSEMLGQIAIRRNRLIPLFGAGISLGGTILLNACLHKHIGQNDFQDPVLDGLICASSPLDLALCSQSIELPRNRLYQRWLLNRLVRQTLADPFVVSPFERKRLEATDHKVRFPPRTIREFDEVITAPRWGYTDVDSYYLGASPLPKLLNGSSDLPPTLILQAIDDPWVPAKSASTLLEKVSLDKKSHLQILLTSRGGHNGFHGQDGCWGDELVKSWFLKLEEDIVTF